MDNKKDKRLAGDNRFMFNSTKLLWHMDRVIDRFGNGRDKRGGKRVAPIHIDAGISKTCNAKCIFCYGIWQKPTKEIMPPEVTINLLRDAGRLGVRSMALIGDGEATMNPALYDAVKAGKAEGLDIGVATNGITLNNDSKIKALVENCKFIRFNVSAIGKDYAQVMGVDQWEQVKKNVAKTIAINDKIGRPCTIGLQMVTVPQSKDSIIPEAQWAVDIGADYFEIKQCSLVDDPKMVDFPLDWYLEAKVEEILDKAQSLSNERTNIVPKWTMMQSLGKRPYDHCLDVSLLAQISGDSKMYPCGYLYNNPKFCYGDLKKQSLEEIINSERYWKIIEYMEKKFDVHKDCKGCCRHDRCNEFLYNYVYKKPNHINFI
ncbi:MAG: radical SAM protein [Patescibacteria group bacterium]